MAPAKKITDLKCGLNSFHADLTSPHALALVGSTHNLLAIRLSSILSDWGNGRKYR